MGMGRELARQLVAEGCNVAMCDVSEHEMAETKRLCEAEKLPQGLRVTTHLADVSDESQLLRFRGVTGSLIGRATPVNNGIRSGPSRATPAEAR